MSDILKGNFKPKNPVTAETKEGEENLEKRFEREALKRLGGSIAFVSKQKVHWGEEEAASEGDQAPKK
jgi:hypothetical protein